jgi:SsrA-binding protein
MPAKASDAPRKLAANRKALHDYTVLEHLEGGIELRGTEVKSIRDGKAGLAGSFVRIHNGQAFVHNLHVPLYEAGNRFNHEPTRVRRLLLHRREIARLAGLAEQKGLTLIPLSLYPKRGRIKMDLAVCKGKRHADRREDMRRRDADRDTARTIAAHRRR